MTIEQAVVGQARQPLNPPKNPPQEKDALGPGSKQPVVEKYIKQLGRFGQSHVQEYLYDLKRRNCRPNTLRSHFTTWMIFFAYLKGRGRSLSRVLSAGPLCQCR